MSRTWMVRCKDTGLIIAAFSGDKGDAAKELWGLAAETQEYSGGVALESVAVDEMLPLVDAYRKGLRPYSVDVATDAAHTIGDASAHCELMWWREALADDCRAYGDTDELVSFNLMAENAERACELARGKLAAMWIRGEWPQVKDA